MVVFDRDEVEACVAEAVLHVTGGPGLTVLDSRAAGVVAFERLPPSQAVDWDEVASMLRDATGLDVACVADCDWSFEDREDEPATFVAFDVPGLEDGYRDPTRSKLSASGPRLA